MSTIRLNRTTDSDTLSAAIVDTVAEFKGVDPVDLTPPLYDVVDPDALDSLFESIGDGPANGRVEFVYGGCVVEVDSSGDVVVSEQRI